MGVGFCVVFEEEVPPYGKLGGDNMALGKAYEKLEAIAEMNGLPTLGKFLSQDAEELAEMMELDAAEMDLPQEQWFNANDGEAAVKALIGFLRNQPTAIAKISEVLFELERVDAELTAAACAKVKFHFAFVP